MMSAQSGVDQLIGQLFVIGLTGLELETGFAAHYSRCPAGWFILFGRNARDRSQVKSLAGALSALATAHNPDLGPPLIAIDQESGTLSPLRGVISSYPGHMGLAATGDPRCAKSAGYATGRELLSLGINLNLAPVLDLAREPLNPVIGTRSFGDDPERVAEFGTAYAEGLIEAGILFAAKHFPGHGSVSEDSHLSLPECRTAKADLLAADVIPFIAALKIPHAAVMVAHVRFAGLDPVRPASLSRPLVTDFLRGELGFDGVVLTDCLEMGGIQRFCPVPEAAVMAIEAGCDLILISHTPDLQEAVFKAIREAVVSGRIALERLERSVARIRRWKRALAALPLFARTVENVPAEELGERVLTYVEGDGMRPWRMGSAPLILVVPAMDRLTPAENGADIAPLLDGLAKCGVPSVQVRASLDPGQREIDDIMTRIETHAQSLVRPGSTGWTGQKDGDVSKPRVALVIRNGGRAPGQAALAAALEEGWEPLLICVRDPREARPVQAALARRAPVVCTYSTEPVVLAALARMLAGQARPKGVMPVSI